MNSLKKKIVILGNESLAKTLGYFIMQDNKYDLIGFAIEKKYIKKKKLHKNSSKSFGLISLLILKKILSIILI